MIRVTFIVLFFAVSTHFVDAQVFDTLRNRLDSLAVYTSRFDSAALRINHKIDSVQVRINNTLSPKLNVGVVFERLRLERIRKDSLNAVRKLDSIKGGLRHKIDSLTALNLPVDKYKRKLDSVSQFSPEQYVAQVQGKFGEMQSKVNKPIDNLESKINKPINDLEQGVNEKLSLMNQEGGAAANLPGSANLGNINLPGSELKMDLNTDINLNTGDLKIPGVESIQNPLQSIENPLAGQMDQVKDVRTKIGDMREIQQQQLDKLKSIDQVEAVQGMAGQANGYVDKAQQYQQDVSKIAKGDIGELEAVPQAIEQRIANLDEMKDFQQQAGEMTKYNDMIAKANDPAAMVEMAKTEAIKYATDHFAGQQTALKTAMDKMSKLKSKYSQVASIKDLPKRVPNPMKGKPLIERLVPGLTFQIQKTNIFLLDLNPVASYRLTGRWSAGLGWNERIAFEKWNKTVSQERIYGPRVFSSFAFPKGFSLKAEVEKMNTFVPNFIANAEGNRAWVWSVFAGFKKDYTFYKKVKGNVQVLYNLYDDHDNSPYLDRLNVRMGFELGLKKKRRAKVE